METMDCAGGFGMEGVVPSGMALLGFRCGLRAGREKQLGREPFVNGL